MAVGQKNVNWSNVLAESRLLTPLHLTKLPPPQLKQQVDSCFKDAENGYSLQKWSFHDAHFLALKDAAPINQ
jgi:hypothetical protein